MSYVLFMEFFVECFKSNLKQIGILPNVSDNRYRGKIG